MEIAAVKDKIILFTKKYKYAGLILIIGISLMLLPNKTANKSEPKAVSGSQERIDSQSFENQLQRILSSVEGAGEVMVLLKQAKGERVIYQTDSDGSTSDSGTDQSVETVIITDGQRNESGLIVQIEPEVYLGAVVVSDGADKPAVKLALVEAVSKLTGLGANQITVLKMK